MADNGKRKGIKALGEDLARLPIGKAFLEGIAKINSFHRDDQEAHDLEEALKKEYEEALLKSNISSIMKKISEDREELSSINGIVADAFTKEKIEGLFERNQADFVNFISMMQSYITSFKEKHNEIEQLRGQYRNITSTECPEQNVDFAISEANIEDLVEVVERQIATLKGNPNQNDVTVRMGLQRCKNVEDLLEQALGDSAKFTSIKERVVARITPAPNAPQNNADETSQKLYEAIKKYFEKINSIGDEYKTRLFQFDYTLLDDIENINKEYIELEGLASSFDRKNSVAYQKIYDRLVADFGTSYLIIVFFNGSYRFPMGLFDENLIESGIVDKLLGSNAYKGLIAFLRDKVDILNSVPFENNEEEFFKVLSDIKKSVMLFHTEPVLNPGELIEIDESTLTVNIKIGGIIDYKKQLVDDEKLRQYQDYIKKNPSHEDKDIKIIVEKYLDLIFNGAINNEFYGNDRRKIIEAFDDIFPAKFREFLLNNLTNDNGLRDIIDNYLREHNYDEDDYDISVIVFNGMSDILKYKTFLEDYISDYKNGKMPIDLKRGSLRYNSYVSAVNIFLATVEKCDDITFTCNDKGKLIVEYNIGNNHVIIDDILTPEILAFGDELKKMGAVNLKALETRTVIIVPSSSEPKQVGNGGGSGPDKDGGSGPGNGGGSGPSKDGGSGLGKDGGSGLGKDGGSGLGKDGGSGSSKDGGSGSSKDGGSGPTPSEPKPVEPSPQNSNADELADQVAYKEIIEAINDKIGLLNRLNTSLAVIFDSGLLTSRDAMEQFIKLENEAKNLDFKILLMKTDLSTARAEYAAKYKKSIYSVPEIKDLKVAEIKFVEPYSSDFAKKHDDLIVKAEAEIARLNEEIQKDSSREEANKKEIGVLFTLIESQNSFVGRSLVETSQKTEIDVVQSLEERRKYKNELRKAQQKEKTDTVVVIKGDQLSFNPKKVPQIDKHKGTVITDASELMISIVKNGIKIKYSSDLAKKLEEVKAKLILINKKSNAKENGGTLIKAPEKSKTKTSTLRFDGSTPIEDYKLAAQIGDDTLFEYDLAELPEEVRHRSL